MSLFLNDIGDMYHRFTEGIQRTILIKEANNSHPIVISIAYIIVYLFVYHHA